GRGEERLERTVTDHLRQPPGHPGEEIGDLEAAQPARGEGALLVVGDQHPSGFAAPEQYGVGQGGEHRLQRWRDRWRRRGAKRRGARTGGDGRAGAGVRAWPAACRPGAGGLTVPRWPEFLVHPPSFRVACEVAGVPPRSWWDATAPDFPGLS